MFKPFKLFDISGSVKSGSSLGAIGVNSVLGPSVKQYKSLIFNSGSSQFLNRTPATSSNAQTATLSVWIKRGVLGSAYYPRIFCAGNHIYLSTSQMGIQDDCLFMNSAGLTSNYTLQSNQVLRDPSAWYHLVYVIDTANATSTERLKMYVNGVKVTSFSVSTYPNQNTQTHYNQMYDHSIGASSVPRNLYYDGYIAEMHWIEGQALGPENFGYTDSIGIWQPKRYSGTYGTNGFYLPLNDSSFSELIRDKSGNGNNWKLNGYSSDGINNFVVSDSPTNNYCTLNPLAKGGDIQAPANGNLQVTSSGSGYGLILGTIGMSSGKWYWEVTTTSNHCATGIATNQANLASYGGVDAYSWVWASYSGGSNKRNNNTLSSYGSILANGDIVGIAFDADNGTLTFYKNNVSQGNAYTSIAAGTYFPVVGDDTISANIGLTVNFGQRPFVYPAPSGFKALCTTNLPTPVIKKPSSYMDVVTYTGTGATQTISGLGFSPDLLWTKGRNLAQNHNIFDTQRSGKRLRSDQTLPEASTTVTLGANGFTLGTESENNNNGSTFVAWAWDEAPIAGMDIVSYTGNGYSNNISHNLGKAPAMVIIKSLTGARGWYVYHQGVGSSPTDSEYYYLLLNGTASRTVSFYNNWIGRGASAIDIGLHNDVVASGESFIAYFFAEVEGFSKFGSYTGNGSADGPFVYCGFRPRWLMVKSSSVSSFDTHWNIFDSTRQGYNVMGPYLNASTPGSESTYLGLDLLSNGFKLRNLGASLNTNATYIFAAFAEHSFKYSRAR